MTVATNEPAQGFHAEAKLATSFDAETASDSTHEMIAPCEADCDMPGRAVARRHAEKVLCGESGARGSPF
jgi:hypothetical protein